MPTASKSVLAIDPATCSGFARGVVGSTPRLESVNFGGRAHDNNADVFGRATKWCARLFTSERFDLVVIEAPIAPYKKQGATTFRTSALAFGLRGVFLGAAAAWGIRTEEVAISTWRKYSLGNGRMTGPEAKQQALVLMDTLQWPAQDHNAAEAACLWLYGCALVQPSMTLRHEPLFAGRGAA